MVQSTHPISKEPDRASTIFMALQKRGVTYNVTNFAQLAVVPGQQIKRLIAQTNCKSYLVTALQRWCTIAVCLQSFGIVITTPPGPQFTVSILDNSRALKLERWLGTQLLRSTWMAAVLPRSPAPSFSSTPPTSESEASPPQWPWPQHRFALQVSAASL